MNFIENIVLKRLRKFWAILFKSIETEKELRINNPDEVAELISWRLESNLPCLIGRFGSTELACVNNYLGVKKGILGVFSFIVGNTGHWYWNSNILNQMRDWSGFFPNSIEMAEKYAILFLKDVPQIDVLGSWLVSEKNIPNLHLAKRIHLRDLEPFWSKKPWTLSLKDKKILIVHPFKEEILYQYKKRDILFEKEIIPEFKSINVIKAVQSIGGDDNGFDNWFEALDFMKSQIDEIDYDIALIGAGAYGFHLAAHVKRSGKKAVHMGGALQLLFGIRGKRWEDPNYGVKEWGIPVGAYPNLINEHWIRPDEQNKPSKANLVEGACYW